MSVFTIDGESFGTLRVTSLEQSFEVLDGKNATRLLSGNMLRDVIGTYYNYKIKIKPRYTERSMSEYGRLMEIVSEPVDSHVVTFPYDIGQDNTHTVLQFDAYITSGKRDMLRYDVNGVDYWGGCELNFIAMKPKIVP